MRALWTATLVGLVAAFAFATSAAASVPAATRVEVEVVVPSGAGTAQGATLRQRLVAAGLAEGVRQVVARHAVPGPPGADPLDQLGGEAARDYVLGYRVLQQLGSRPVAGGAPGAREVAARVEVDVDSRGVVRRLTALGVRADTDDETAETGLYRVSTPLNWEAWKRFERALMAAGASRVLPHEVGPTGMMIRIEARGAPGTVVRRVRDRPPEGLRVSWDGPPSRSISLSLIVPEGPASLPAD